MKRVLILCTGNSCRSQMAEALWASLGGPEWESVSAGSQPTGSVHPLAVAAMREIGIDISSNVSKSVEPFQGQPFDMVITVCGHAREACPNFPGAKQTLHWPFDDPALATGDAAEKMAIFRRVRDEIQERVQRFLAESTAH